MYNNKKPKYCGSTTALKVLKDVDLTGKTILITGTTAGIGRETARSLALKGAHVVIANRNVNLSEELRDEIYKETSYRKIDIIQLDLNSLASVKHASEEYLSKGWPLNVLILNAGVNKPPNRATKDGYESTFGVNHLGHFYLTYLLMNKLRESAPSRLVVVSSDLHSRSGIKPSASLDEKLNKLIPNPPEEDIALGRGSQTFTSIVAFVSKPFTKNFEQGAATTVYCAASPFAENESGRYYADCNDAEKDLHKALARDESLQDALWSKSLEFIKKFERNNVTHL
uniref:Uncharacterized protein n=1 Tax=Acrobeloides nanus TaxID=290746 RepID=A0A914DWN9_9BILA